MMGKLFEGGIPTRMDVDRLYADLDPQSGKSIAYEAVEGVLGIGHKENRFRTVTGVWRKRIFRERNLQSVAEDGAFHFLNADQAFDHGIKTLHRIGRATGRLHVRAGSIVTNELTGSRRDRHHLMVRETQAMAEVTRKAAKQIASPKPVQPSLRLAQNK